MNGGPRPSLDGCGTKSQGEFEERPKAVLKQFEVCRDKIVCIIDELLALVVAGASEGSTVATNMLKSALGL